MTITLVSHEDNKAKYTVTCSWERFDEEVNRIFHKEKGRIQVPGFRKGKAPRKLVEMHYGEGLFYEDALNALVPHLIEEAVKELELEPIGSPDVDVDELKKGEDLTFTITTQTLPHPKVGDISSIEIEKLDEEVSDEDITQRLENEQKKNAVKIAVDDRAVEDGDEVTLDYAGSVDGEAFDGGTAEDQKLVIGSKSFIPGFEEQLIGHNVGEEFDITVTFPEEYHAEELKGKEAVFHINLKGISVEELPAMDDEFAQDVSEFDTLEEYKASIREELVEAKKKMNRNIQENQAVAKLAEVSDVKVPDVMVEEQVDSRVRDAANQMQQMGLSIDQYLSVVGKDMEAFREEFREEARNQVAGSLILQSLAEEREISVSEEELSEEIKRVSEVYGAQDPEDFEKRLRESGMIPMVENDVKLRKAVNLLMEEVRYVDAKEEPKEEE